MNWFKKEKVPTATPKGDEWVRPIKGMNEMHSVGDMHDFLKARHNAKLETVWNSDGSKKLILTQEDGTAFVGQGATVDEATADLVKKVGV